MIPFPNWCELGQIVGDRVAVCGAFTLTMQTVRWVGNTPQVTGVAMIDVLSYTYSSEDYPEWMHQLGLYMWSGWGDAMRAAIDADASGDGTNCTLVAEDFPTQPLLPINHMVQGDARYRTTVSQPGEIRQCDTNWKVTARVPGYPNATNTHTMREIRCDDVVGAYLSMPRRVGCVNPWYPQPLRYLGSAYPTLSAHVLQAQGSGLPGAWFDAPLYRTSNQAIIDRNRALACGGHTRPPERSCDEYPPATTLNGLAMDGELRSFPGCGISAPVRTGPTGASACMIQEREQSGQGGKQAHHYYRYRIIEEDPWLVWID